MTAVPATEIAVPALLIAALIIVTKLCKAQPFPGGIPRGIEPTWMALSLGGAYTAGQPSATC